MAVLVREAAAVSFAQQAQKQAQRQAWRQLELTDSELAALFYSPSSCCIPGKANLGRTVVADSDHGHRTQKAHYNQTQVDQAISHNIDHTMFASCHPTFE